MLRLGLTKKTLIVISALIVLLVFGSVFLVYYQEEEMKEIRFAPHKINPELKVQILEQGLNQILPIEMSLIPWANLTKGPKVNSNLLFAKAFVEPGSAKCIPVGLGYTLAESNKLFDPAASYPDCSTQTPVTVKFENNKLMKVCDKMEYFLGTSPEEDRFGRVPYHFKWLKMPGNSADTLNREFAFIKCGEMREAVVFFKKNPKAAARAISQTKKLSDSMGLASPPKPITIFMLIFDSLSRNHMYRSFPETMKFLNTSIGTGQYSKKLVMYDFLINHAHGENTIPNMIPFLFGYNFNYHKLRLGNRSHFNPEDNDFFVSIQKDALWKHFERMGFVTLFGFDVIWDFLVPAVGREIKTDHVFTNFWKASSKVFGTDNYINEQECFGSFDSHRYMLDYVESYLKEYKGVNRFGYTHITTAHEKSGTIIKTVDDDLVKFFKDTLEFYEGIDEDVFFIVAGDHGKHVSERDIVKPGWLENMLPGHIVIASKDLIEKLKADETLKHNTKRLVSRPDWHLTMKQLSTSPYGQLPKDSSLYTHWKKLAETDYSVSLLMEKVPESRTCEDVNIDDCFCVCLPYKEIPSKDWPKYEYISAAIKASFDSINKSIKNRLCQKLTFDKVLYAAIREIDSDYQVYRFRVGIKENPDVVIEIYAGVFPKDKEERYTKVEVPFKASDFKDKMFQLLKVVRIDEYGGYMEEFSVVIQEKPHFCIPVLPEALTVVELLKEDMSNALDALIDQIDLRAAPHQKTCYSVCKQFDQICQPWALQLLSNELILFPVWHSTVEITIKYQEKDFIILSQFELGHNYGDLLSFSNSSIFYTQRDFSCFSTSSTLSLICPCKK